MQADLDTVSQTKYLRILLFFILLPGISQADDKWMLVDTGDQTLSLFSGEKLLLHFEGIAIGRNGVTRSKILGDKRTPLGNYKVAWFNPKSRFHYFIGLDYPRREQVLRAHQQGVIDQGERDRLVKAWYRGNVPPQNSPLGGQIGIHGIGNGSRWLHEISNWTEGCVALTNEEIDRLRPYVNIGMRVIIRE